VWIAMSFAFGVSELASAAGVDCTQIDAVKYALISAGKILAKP